MLFLRLPTTVDANSSPFSMNALSIHNLYEAVYFYFGF